MSQLPGPCVPFEADLSALIDGALAPARQAEVRAHVECCARCSRQLRELCDADLALASLRAPTVTAQLAARMRERLAGERAAAPRASRAPRRPRRWLGGAAAAAAAAAAVLWLALPRERTPAPGPPLARGPAAPQPVPAPELAARAPAIARQPPTASETPDAALSALPDEDLALLFDLDTVEDLDVIANLDLLEDVLDLEASEGAG